MNVPIFGVTGMGGITADIQPLHGIKSKTASSRIVYTWSASLLSLTRRILPSVIVTTEQVGQAMLNVARRGWPAPVLEQRDLARAAEV